MQILLAFIVGALVGILAHYTVGHRLTRGVALAPIIGSLSAAVAWAALTWAGLGIDNPLIWLSTLVVPAVVTYPVLLIATRLRRAKDASDRERLKIS